MQEPIPYFYIIQEASTGIYYAGAKWGNDANPENFMVEGGYTTSSILINNKIQEFGLDHFIIRKKITFKSKEEAWNYENKFLKRVSARNNPRFYNMHNNDGILNALHYKEHMLTLYGVDHNMKVPEIAKNRMNTINKKWGSFSNMLKVTGGYQKSRETVYKKYGVSEAYNLPHAIENKNKVNMKKYGTINPFNCPKVQKEMKAKSLLTFAKNYEERQKPIIELILSSDIDFSKHGWGVRASKIIGINPIKVKQWMLRNMPEFYEEKCYKRSSPKRKK